VKYINKLLINLLFLIKFTSKIEENVNFNGRPSALDPSVPKPPQNCGAFCQKESSSEELPLKLAFSSIFVVHNAYLMHFYSFLIN